MKKIIFTSRKVADYFDKEYNHQDLFTLVEKNLILIHSSTFDETEL
jgi:phage regulator Rha-like protein